MTRWHVALVVAATLVVAPTMTLGQSASDIQQQIDQHNAQINQLNQEISQYEQQLKSTTAKKQTLQNTINQIAINIKKTTSQVGVLQNQIGSTQLQIEQLAGKITDAQSSIDRDSAGLAETMRILKQEQSRPLAMQLLTAGSVQQVWDNVEMLSTIDGAIESHIHDLTAAQQSLSSAKASTESKQNDLLNQREALRQQQGSLTAQKNSQSDLLAQTKSQESNYQKIIAQKKAQEAQFEAALTNLKAQYQQAINPSSIPQSASGILAWPLDSVRITQYFGNTPFAATGAYNGKGHNGIDLAASIGTPVHAALAGVVRGTGNTDAVRTSAGQCYSFGKWVYVSHANGLGTIYAHLSEIDVSEGQKVSTGQLLGYSGETGYATGPHLHFGVYVDSATKIIRLGEATNGTSPCAYATMPVPTSLAGYLNPLSYLPPTPSS